ncbi:MAG: TetR family transcriptional regulator C-terminal domain-containing protein [Pseudomonadota bacterium]
MAKRPKTAATKRPNGPIRDQRRRELIEATIAVIAAHGYAGTTVARVAKEAHVSVGLMNFHFRSMDRLFAETFRFIAAEFDAIWRELAACRPDEPPERRLWRMIEAYFDPRVFTERKVAVWFAFWSDANLRDRFRAAAMRVERRYIRELEQAVRETARGQGIAPAAATAMADALTAAIDGLWLQFMLSPRRNDRAHALATCRGLLGQFFPALRWKRKAPLSGQRSRSRRG